jgi:amino acid adenylation domain-containing protein
VFLHEAESRPEAIALRSHRGAVSYGELHRGALCLASYLSSFGISQESRVAVVIARSDTLITALLGIIYAGGAYVAIDPSWPVEHCSQLIEQSSAACLITSSEHLDSLPVFWGPVVNVDADANDIAAAALLDGPVRVEPDSLAYISFTSGSAGLPKPVGVTHRNVLRLVKGTNYGCFDRDRVFLQYAPVAFDASTFEIWGALLNGATLAVAPPVPLSIYELGACVQAHGVTTMWLTAGLFHQFAQSDLGAFTSIRELLTGGDRVSPAAAQRVLAALPACRLINGYGPTETTTFGCTHAITPLDAAGCSVPIGRPIANTRVYVLDSALGLCPCGIPGELYIGGDGVARGYVNAPDLTAERFIPDPFGSAAGGRLYRTGDIVRQRADGVIEFIGRADSQVKVRGYRVEPDEVAAALCRIPGVRDAIAVAREAGGETQIWAYVVPFDSALTTASLRSAMAAAVPDYLVPSGFVFIDSIPLTRNGKPDRQALPPPEAETIARCSVPRDVIEFQLGRILGGGARAPLRVAR